MDQDQNTLHNDIPGSPLDLQHNHSGLFMPIIPSEYCGGLENPGMAGMPNLQQVSSGIWSDFSYEHEPHQLPPGEYEEEDGAASMENNRDLESDYDFDVSEENESEFLEEEDDDDEEDVEEEEESFEEEEMEEEEDDVLDLVDNLEVKFKQLVFSTIDAAEQFLDDANILHLGVLHGSLSLGQGATEEEEDACCGSQILKESQMGADDNPNNSKVESGCHVGVQTEDDSSLTRSSGTLVPAQNNLKAEQAELEVAELEAVRESLMSELRHWRRLLKKDDAKTEEEFKEAGRTICQIQESIDAIDEAISFKSEIIAPGAGTAKGPQNQMEFSQMVTSLETLSLHDLQRLMGTYFTKTVELKFSSLQVEHELEDATNRQDDLNQRLKRKSRQVKELQEQHQTRILEFLCKNTDPSYYSRFRRKEEQLAAARKRQDDLEKSLTALLVRHGYLLDGVDYDVRQVVRTLGIDETQIAAVEATKGRITRRGGISAEMEEYSSPPGGGQSSSPAAGPSTDNQHRRHYPPPGRHLPSTAVAGAVPSTPQPTAEVRREKRRLIIQPGTSSGAGGGSSPSSANPTRHAGSSNTRKGHHH